MSSKDNNTKKKDYIGKKYGNVTVLEKTNEKKHNRPLYLCKCDCGTDFLCTISTLTSGDKKSCGCKRKLDLTNKKFGRLTAIKPEGVDNRGNVLWLCQCDCGNYSKVVATELSGGRTQSCGCVRLEKAKISKHRKDYSGQKFGYLVVIEKLNEKSRPGEYFYLCECECGKQIKTTIAPLLCGDRVSCGCKRRDDLIGKTFGRWTVLEYVGNRQHKCICECGNEGVVFSSNLVDSSSQSCGCLANELTSQNKLKDITGLRSGKLVAQKLMDDRDNAGNAIWECLCDCGRISHVRSKDISAKTTQSCGNCGTFIRGIRVSKPQMLLHKLLGRGVINFKTRCGLRPDIAFVYNGRKIAVEYDEMVWHDPTKDLEKTKRLLKDGWKVLRFLVNDVQPDQSMIDETERFLNTECDHFSIK
jgi:very-short-patch-repair endonuclease